MTCLPLSSTVFYNHLHCHWKEPRKRALAFFTTSSFPQHALTRQFTIVDTHTHILLTFALYRSKYSEGEYEIDFDFVEGVHVGERVETVVVRAGSVHARNIEGAGGWEMGGFRFVVVSIMFLPSRFDFLTKSPAGLHCILRL